MSAGAASGDRPRDPIAAVTHRDPYPYYEDLVASRPLYRDGALGLWVACSAAAVTDALANPACLVRPPDEPVPVSLVGSPAGAVFGRLVRMNDGARHSAMTPGVSAAIARIETSIGGQATRCAERLADEIDPARDAARLNEFVFSLSAYVVASSLGIAPRELPRVAGLAGDFALGIAPAATGERLTRGADAAGQLLAAFDALLAARGAGAPPTALADLYRALAEREDAVANGIGFLSQAYEATAGLIGNTLVALGRHAAGGAIGAGGDLGSFVREVVRFDPPVHNTRRFVARNTTVAGQEMEAGDVVLVVLAAANRDPAVNPEPSRFDPVRPSRRAFTFGSGPHACPGEAIASAIAEAGVRQLLARGVDPAELARSVTYRPSVNTRVPIF
jgi:cytochrome P450